MVEAVVVARGLLDAVNCGKRVGNPIDGAVVGSDGNEVQTAVLADRLYSRYGKPPLLGSRLVEANDFFGSGVNDVKEFVKPDANVGGAHKSREGRLNGYVGDFADAVVGYFNEVQVGFGPKVVFAAAQRGSHCDQDQFALHGALKVWG